MDFSLQLVKQLIADQGTLEFICRIAENHSSMHYSREVFLKTYERRPIPQIISLLTFKIHSKN